jgi:hypothetical protein
MQANKGLSDAASPDVPFTGARLPHHRMEPMAVLLHHIFLSHQLFTLAGRTVKVASRETYTSYNSSFSDSGFGALYFSDEEKD